MYLWTRLNQPLINLLIARVSMRRDGLIAILLRRATAVNLTKINMKHIIYITAHNYYVVSSIINVKGGGLR